MFRFPYVEYLWQTGITALIGSLAFVRTESYSLTPLGQAAFLFAVFGLVAVVGNAFVPREREVDQGPAEPSFITMLIFAGLCYGIVKQSWFGIFPSLAKSIGIPDGFSDRLAAAIAIGLMVGLIALAACGIAEMLQAFLKTPSIRRFARTASLHP